MIDGSELLQRLLVTFRGEAEDHLRELSALLALLEQAPEDGERTRLIEALFRRMHTLKGAAHAVNLLEVAELCQALENLLAALKRGELSLGPEVTDRLRAQMEEVERSIFAPAPTPAPEAPPVAEPSKPRAQASEPVPAAVSDRRESPAPPKGEPPRPPTPREPAAPQGPAKAAETVRVPVQLLESLLLQSEELLSAKLMVSDLVQGLSELSSGLALRGEERNRAAVLAEGALRAGGGGKVAPLAQLAREQGEREAKLGQRLAHLSKSGERAVWALGGMVGGLLEDMKKLQLLPFSSLADTFPRLVRELAHELGKEAEFSFSGGEMEIDRRILAELKEPLLHLLRNVIDHGIESPSARRLKGKSPKGRVHLQIRHLDGNRAEITVSDDGAGIDPARVRAAALRLELIAPEQAQGLSDADALQLVFESGLSTSAMITSISGRGLGLAIVREALEKLGGHATVASAPEGGTVFRLLLPLSFAMISALLVEVSGRSCLIPAANVELNLRLPSAEIRSVENRETVAAGGRVLSLARLARILELPESEEPAPFQQVVVLAAGDKRMAFAVDAVVGVQEVLVKPLGPQLSRVKNVAGGTVLGSGKVVPILNVNDLFRSAATGSGATLRSAPKPGRRGISVLVAEDSITSRTLLKNILEGAGFSVTTAVDGAEALSFLKSEEVDIVVSDVEMPRMDGFELTAAIRADRRLSELPVILVTGLESREDRERGIDVGANAYIVKSSFDQGGLVEVIRKLA